LLNKQQIIELLSKEVGFKNLCNKLCQYNDIANDLYQEFMLVVCETSEEVLKEKVDKGLINFFCVRVIININNKRSRLTKDGEQNTLLNLTSFCGNLSNYLENFDENVPVPVNLTYDPQGTEIYQTAKKLLMEDMASKHEGTQKNAIRLYETCFLHKNLYQYSLTQDVSRQAIMKSVKRASEKLKKRL